MPKIMSAQLMDPYYRIAGFSFEDFNLAVWSIHKIKTCEKFHHVKKFIL